jgi:predicted nucleic acid-binding protein
MMDPPKVLLERSFLHAVADASNPNHAAAAAEYLELVTQYEAEEILLVAVHTHLGELVGLDRKHVFAPVDRLWVGRQHRRAVTRSRVADDPEFALTLVMAERHRVRTVASFDPRFLDYELTVLPAAAVD